MSVIEKLQWITERVTSTALSRTLRRKIKYPVGKGKFREIQVKTAYDDPKHTAHKQAVALVTQHRQPANKKEKAEVAALTPQQQGQYRQRDKSISHAEAIAAIKAGKAVRKKDGYRPATAAEIKSLGVGDRWVDVLVPVHGGDAKALGIDKRGRAQMIQSEKAKTESSQSKFKRVEKLMTHLGELDKALAAGIKKGDPHAFCLSIIRRAGIRPSTDKMSGEDKTFGATTMQARHVTVMGDTVKFDFIGKKSVRNVIKIKDAEFAKEFKKFMHGKSRYDEVFPGVTAHSLQAYQRTILPKEFVLKDLRTSVGTQTALEFLKTKKKPKNEKEKKKLKSELGKYVAKKLGNTPAVALKSYIDPSVYDYWK